MNLLSAQYHVPQHILDKTREFFLDRGREGCEGTALWIGRSNSETIHIGRLFIPEQICTKTPWGLSVDLTVHAHYTLTDNLDPGELFYVRIHSHPREAYHSAKDDANPILTHQGAISIVVPYFAKEPIQLESCAVYRLVYGEGWLLLAAAEVLKTIKVTT